MEQAIPWLDRRGGALCIACPICGNGCCHIQTVAVCQKGMEVAVTRRHVLTIEGPSAPHDYRVETRFFCSYGHRFAVHFIFDGRFAGASCQPLPNPFGLPLLELER